MRWYDNSSMNRGSYVTLSGINLYKINDEIYDEVVKRVDGYYVIQRCGFQNYYDPEHTFTIFATNELSYIIYPLVNARMIKLDWDLPLTFGDNTQVVMDYQGKAPTIDFSINVDRRYLEYVSNFKGTELDVTGLPNYDTNRQIEVLEIESVQDNIGEPFTGEKGEQLYRVKISLYDEYNSEVVFNHVVVPQQLMVGDRVVWNSYNRGWYLVSGINAIDVKKYNPQKITFAPVQMNKVNKLQIHAGVEMTLALPMKEVRELAKPKNLKSIIDEGKCTITWDMVSGADAYMIFKGGEYFETVNEPEYITFEEIRGYISIKATNTLGKQSSMSESVYVHSVPNNPFIIFIDNIWKNNRYYITVYFQDNSQLEDHYRIRYKVDDRAEQYVEVAGSNVNGTTLQHTIEVPYIMEQILIRVTSVNESGENVIAPYEKLLMSVPDYQWGYNSESRQMVLSWKHIYEDATHYTVRYKLQGEEDYKSVESACGQTPLGQSVTAYIPCGVDKEVEVSIGGVIKETIQLYTKPELVSKKKDKNSVAPSGFRYLVEDDRVTFYWKDDYKVEDNFQFVYSFANGEAKTIYVNSDSKEQTGKEYSYTYIFEEHGFINAKIRMGWALANSEYTEEVLIYYLPVSGLPPEYVYKTRIEENLTRITWESQLYVEWYLLHIIKNGEQQVVKCIDNNYNLELDYNGDEYEIFVITRFLGETETGESPRIIFRPVTSTRDSYRTTIYTEHSIETKIAASVFTPYVGKTLFREAIKSQAKSETKYWQLSLNTFLLSKFGVHLNIWGKDVVNTPMVTSIYKPNMVQTKPYLNTTVFVKTETPYNHNVFLYTPFRRLFPINVEINKLRIATMGDSITAGHPGFWAESMTGDERSQYQYWLQRRIGDNFEVLNKGYGRDTSSLLLARFERDLAPLNAQFCVIQIGTNDLFEAQKAGKDDQKVLDSYVDAMRKNMQSMVDVCFKLGVTPVIGNLIPRTGFKGIYRDALWSHNEWLKNLCNTTEGVLFVNFYDAGKSNIPPTPLEDSREPGAMNPIYDGDTVYDDHGNVVTRGNGIHPNAAGYKLMGEAIPLSYFQTTDKGLKLYVDKECMIEEKLDETNTIQKVYLLSIPNIIRGRKKFTTRYIKNEGNDRLMYAIFPTEEIGLNATFKLDDSEEEVDIANGVLLPNGVHKLDIFVDIPKIGDPPELYLGMATRRWVSN